MNLMELYDCSFTSIEGQSLHLSDYKDQMLLIVNTASECGFTPQYSELEMLWQEYKERGLTVIGCPCNQFGEQEAGDESTIKSFCQLRFGVTFPLTQKLEVNGAGAHPAFQIMKAAAPGILFSPKIKWNFTKFLIAPRGASILRFGSITPPRKLKRSIEKRLPN